MRYLGGLSGTGSLQCNGETLAEADYDIDGFLTRPGHVTGSGEIRTSPEVLREVFGRADLELLTEDGRVLSLRFSDKQLEDPSDAAHVDVSGELPQPSEWRG